MSQSERHDIGFHVANYAGSRQLQTSIGIVVACILVSQTGTDGIKARGRKLMLGATGVTSNAAVHTLLVRLTHVQY